MRFCGRCSLAILLTLLPVGQGCKTPGSASKPLALNDQTWGRAVEGLQCRLRATRASWQSTETPTFLFDLRNSGKRTFAFWPAHKLQFCEVEIDGKWRRWPDAVMLNSAAWPLTPGAQYNAVTLDLEKPGKHIIRIAFELEGVRVVSNPVRIKILPAPK